MKSAILLLAMMLPFTGCAALTEVDFVYFNLSTNEIFVDSIAGLPVWASPGVLVPVHAEDQLSESSMTSWDPVRVAAKLTIVWREGGKIHQVELKRDDLGIPAKVKKGKVRFSYLGGDKWRVRYLEKDSRRPNTALEPTPTAP
jgi:hypothetical protein